MKFKEALNTYLTGSIVIAGGVIVWVLVRSWEWMAVLSALGASNIVARLLLRRRRPNA